MHTTTLTQKGQLTIPKPFRDLLQWFKGEKLYVDLHLTGKEIKIKAKKDVPNLMSLQGAWGPWPKKLQKLDADQIIKLAKHKALSKRHLK